ncbi:MAG TPA: T9SS type A sorting domain-containing protein [Ignavibacteriaceae bacterium]|nr:T9SS type A sorting domain-containing protein [Ignavibacteriaceae bacterium]
MKKIIIISFLLQIVFSVYCYSQFNGYYGKINKKPAYACPNPIVSLGDQNNDGYDDFMICEWQGQLLGGEYDTLYTFYFYKGGAVLDTVPCYKFSIPYAITYGPKKIIVKDINRDGYKDIIVAMTRITQTPPFIYTAMLHVYYCGPVLDSIPDQIVNSPDGASKEWGLGVTLIKDFNGDGIEELACYDPNTPFSSSQWGTMYFYKIENGYIDTIPFKTTAGNSIERDKSHSLHSIDINNDGLADIIISGDKKNSGGYSESAFKKIFLGNSDWDITTPSQEFRTIWDQYQIEMLRSFVFIKDINRDGKVDLISKYVGDPYWHKGAIKNGGYPVDTTIWKTLNTSNGYLTREIAEEIDANGDGINDLLVKMFGLGTHDTYLWLGTRNFQQFPTKKWRAQEQWEGRFSGNIGDVNGDGADDIFIGQCHQDYLTGPGKVQIFLGDTSVHVDTTMGTEEENKMPRDYQLLAAYPNPFNPETVISYQLPVNSKVILGIYDILGREVSKLVDAEQEAGKHEVRFNGSGLASGVYIVRCSYRQSDGLEVINSLKIELIK